MVSQKRGFFLLLALLFLVMLLLNALTPWIADDYRYAFSFATEEKLHSIRDIFPSLKAHTYVMNGRCTPHFWVHLFTLLPLWAFDVCNSAVFVLMIMGMHRLIMGKRQYDVLLLCALTAGLFVTVPAFGPSFLWMAGSCNYLWCDVLLIWLLVPFADAVMERGHEPAPVFRLLMIPAALFFGNMSQNVSASGVMLMGLAMLWLKWKKHPVRWWMMLTALAAFAGWLLCLSSPADRGMLERGASSIGALLDQFQQAAEAMIQHGTIPSIGLLILAVSAWYDGMDRNRIAAAIGLFVTALACNYVMAVSFYYPDRAFTGSALMLVCGCGILLPKARSPKWKASIALSLVLMMGLSLVHALPDLYDCYAMAQDREMQVTQAVENGETALTTFGIESRSSYDGFHQLHDLTIDPNAMENIYYARYHGLDAIVIDRIE